MIGGIKTVNPFVGFVIASISDWLNRGNKTPLSVLFKSKIAEESGGLPSLFIATCAVRVQLAIITIAIQKSITFFFSIGFVKVMDFQPETSQIASVIAGNICHK